MGFQAVMQNLAIGIASGIFSSVIVSVVFYLLNEFQTELDKANDMIYPLYGIIVFGKAMKKFERCEEINVANDYFNEAINNFARFEPWRFKGSLHNAMCQINEIIMDGKYSDENMDLYPEMIEEFSEKLENQLDVIQKNEKNFAKELLKRIFKNKIIIVTLIIFGVIILVA